MRSSFIIILGAGLFALGGCDRQSEPAPQANATQESPRAQENTGTVDRSGRGAPMPDAAFTAPDGTIGTLQKFQGKPLLVNFWATWCGPCIKEMPTLERLAAREGGALKVLTVSQDSKGVEAVKPWFAKNRYTHLEAYIDPETALGLAAGVEMLPTTILYDAQGKEVWRVMGGMAWDGSDAAKLFAETSVR